MGSLCQRDTAAGTRASAGCRPCTTGARECGPARAEGEAGGWALPSRLDGDGASWAGVERRRARAVLASGRNGPAAGLDCWAAGREEVSWAREKKWATGFGLDLSFGFLGWVLGVWVSFS